MKRVNVHDAKTHLSSLLSEVEGKPIADLRPITLDRDPLRRNPRLALVKFSEDPVLPLAPEDWPQPDDDLTR